MAGTYAVYYRNHDGSDSTRNDSYTSSSPCPTIDTFGWSAPSGKSFKEWNTSRDGSGTSMFPGETYTQIEGNRYAIWEDAPVPYLTDDKEIKSIADAIRTKGGTSSALVYPTGFVTAIGNISTGGGVDEFIETDFTSSYENSTVTKIGAGKFAYQSSMKAVSFPACTYIGDAAFYYCSSLTTVSFPACTSIGSNAFYLCSKLTTASFPACTYIGDKAFSSCSSLTTVSFPACTTIKYAAFAYCSSLTTVNFPSCTSTMEGYTFNYCTKLTTASFPVCTAITPMMFYHCSKLTTVSFPACTYIGNDAFNYCPSLTTVNFPSCRTIMTSAFASCTSLTTASFPACTAIRSSAFNRCYNLVSLYLMGSSVASLLNTNAFFSTPISGYTGSTGGVYGSIYVPSSLLTAYKSSTNWTYFSSRFVGV